MAKQDKSVSNSNLAGLDGSDEAETGTALAVVSGQGGALAVLEPGLLAACKIEGSDDASNTIPRLVMFQGTVEESTMYGDHPRGMFLDALESRPLGKSVSIVPITGWMSFAKWEKGSSVPLYSHKDKSKVPADDLQWGEDGTPPACSSIVNLVCLVASESGKLESWPYLLQFKRSATKAYKSIQDVETRRSMTKRGPGVYQLSSEIDKNKDGQPYNRMKAKFSSELTPDMVTLANVVYTSIQQVKASAEAVAETAPSTPGTEIPF
jgi:hypothetical protein